MAGEEVVWMGPARFTAKVTPTVGTRIARLLRAPMFVFGKLFVVLGIVVLILSAAMLGILAVANDPPPTQGDWLLVAGGGAGGIVAIVLGRVSVRGRRHLVLFLRKFGYRDATAATSYAAERAMGRRWRLVTLDDDSATAPIGVSPATRRRSNLLGLLGVLVIVGTAALSTWWVVTGGPGDMYDSIADSSIAQFEEENPDASFGDSLGAALGAALAGVFLLLILFVYGIVALLTVWTACLGLWTTRIAVRRADRSKSWRMDSDAALQPVADLIGKRSRKVHAPRMFVVRAADRVWQGAVRALADCADTVIIDISRPTENLLWEIRELRQRHGVNWVLVCAADSEVVHGSSAGPELDELLSLIRGEQVLTYTPGDIEERRFARSLRNQLDRSLHRA